MIVWKDPIVEEIHKFREEYAAQFNYDIHAMYEDLKNKEEERKIKEPWRFVERSQKHKNSHESSE